ncbi:MAG: hypothetical protein Q7Q71_11685 [Verrucomicrobiota bacterium JB023]|nr:hypothetical protein [Verrucomicrobiota bacterium JB023]
MKQVALTLASIAAALVFTSCCGLGPCGQTCGKKQDFAHVGCENHRYVEKEVTEWVEEQVVVEGKGAKGVTETVTVRRPIVKTVREEVPCGTCGSVFCATPDCCGIVPKAVLSRATAQGATGEPHIGTIPTMKVLVSGAEPTNEL